MGRGGVRLGWQGLACGVGEFGEFGWWGYEGTGAEKEQEGGKEKADQGDAEPGAQRGVVADQADQAGAGSVTEGVDEEELDRDGGGADGGGNGVDDGGVERAVAEEDAEESYAEAGYDGRFRSEEAEHGGWDGEQG